MGAFFIPDGTFHDGMNICLLNYKKQQLYYILFLRNDNENIHIPVQQIEDAVSFPFHFTVWFYFGLVGSFIFIIIQLILLIDFAHSWNKAWVENAENGNKCWFAGNVFKSFVIDSIFDIALTFFNNDSAQNLI